MRVSLVIPHYESDPEKRMILNNCLNSMTGQYQELIVIADKIDNLAVKINMGLRKATGDFIIISNDDVVMQEGTLSGLCKDNEVLSPTITSSGASDKVFHAHMWGMPRSVYAQLGGMDEDYLLYWMDTDYAMRMIKNNIPCNKTNEVKIIHDHPARTMGFFAGKTESNDEGVFIKKWGERIHDPFRR